MMSVAVTNATFFEVEFTVILSTSKFSGADCPRPLKRLVGHAPVRSLARAKPDAPHNQPGRLGPCAQEDGQRLKDRFPRYHAELLRRPT